ncbi:MAG TPA: heavy metal-associated domain-containing protein [Rubrobacteraceae bacterium]|nr:heavy metal-associated domain-containing protein [Rubrobacteraceae bacterium]
MPDVTLVVRGITDTGEAEKLERALTRMDFVQLANVDQEKGLVAVSYDGGASELKEIEGAIEEAGYEYSPSPGAESING